VPGECLCSQEGQRRVNGCPSSPQRPTRKPGPLLSPGKPCRPNPSLTMSPFRYLCPGCHRLGDTPGRCTECTHEYERERRRRRGKTAARGYNARWRRLVELAIRAHPYCVDCPHTGSPDNPLTGDHIIPRANGGPNTLDNIAVRCRVCNGRRGATMRRRVESPFL
jgi:5-methylcytosine-specific restriction enzyme A